MSPTSTPTFLLLSLFKDAHGKANTNWNEITDYQKKKKKRNAHVTFEETTAIKVMSWMVATQKEFHSK